MSGYYLAPSDAWRRVAIGTARHRDRLYWLSLVDGPRSTREVRWIYVHQHVNTPNALTTYRTKSLFRF